MARKAKKLLITTFSHELFIVRAGGDTAIRGFCPVCESEVDLLTLDAATSAAGVTGRQLIGRLATSEVHSIETVNGHLLVCRRSLKIPQ